MNAPFIDISEFTKSLHKDVVRFEQWWKDRARKKPSIYPHRLTEDEWQGQFLTWSEFYSESE